MSYRSAKADQGTPLLEWIAASIGAVMAIGTISYLVWDGLGSADTPADLTVRVEEVAPVQEGFRVEVAVSNRGGRTAAEAKLDVRSRAEDGSEEHGEITFDYVPGHSTRHGAVLFRRQPRAESLDLRVLGYRDP
jgi:uncharacterized protein (TIGR02588 family)